MAAGESVHEPTSLHSAALRVRVIPGIFVLYHFHSASIIDVPGRDASGSRRGDRS